MSIFQAIILGIVEGITEFIPVSSTAHLVLVAKALGLETTEFLKTFEIAIQVGAVLAVVVVYWQSLLKNWSLNWKIVTAFIPTAVVGAFLYPVVKSVFLGNPMVSVYALFLGGLFLIIFELFYKNEMALKTELNQISHRQSFVVGCVQAVSIIPGVSRAAATILGGLSLQLSRRVIVEFSFLLAIPTIIGAAVFDLSQSAHLFSGREVGLLIIGVMVSFIVAWVTVKLFLKFVKFHPFTVFGVYRIIIAFVFWLLT